jgi:capsular exopolysaccharide synthesis family protein
MHKSEDMIVAPPTAAPLGYALPYTANRRTEPSLASQLPSEATEPSLAKPILRQWWIVLLLALFGAGIATIYLKYAQPLYTSYAKIYLPPTVGPLSEMTSEVTERESFLQTQASIVGSNAVMMRVAEMDAVKNLKSIQNLGRNPTLYLQDQVHVDVERKTDLITISMTSPYADDAFTIVDATVRAYNEYVLDEKDDESTKILANYDKDKSAAEQEADELFKAIQAYRKNNPGASMATSGNNVADENLKLIEGRLTTAQLNLSTARISYGANHRIVQQLEDQVLRLQKMYDKQMSEIVDQTDKSGQLAEMNRRYEQKQGFIKKLGDEIQAIQLKSRQRKLMEVNVVEPPHIAEAPSWPRKNRTLSVAIVVGGLLGAGLALLRDRLDGRLRSIDEVQTVVGLPILGVVPAMSGRRTAVARAMTVHLDPRSVVAEAYRTIRTAVYFGGTSDCCKTILMTSPESGDGKTTSASNLAIAIAQTGRTVLLLDADFRKPTQHKNLDIKDVVGLSSVLAGFEPIERAIQHTAVEGLDILPCGPIPANPSEILNSREFGELIDALAARYDHIIFDSPPVNAVTDARILGAVCDTTILVLRADKSTRRAGEHARNSLLAVGANVAGAIVNDAPRTRGYDVYGAAYYYGSRDTVPTAGVVPAARRLTSSTASSVRRGNTA